MEQRFRIWLPPETRRPGLRLAARAAPLRATDEFNLNFPGQVRFPDLTTLRQGKNALVPQRQLLALKSALHCHMLTICRCGGRKPSRTPQLCREDQVAEALGKINRVIPPREGIFRKVLVLRAETEAAAAPTVGNANQGGELERLLGKFGQDSQRIEDSVLIGCSEQQEAWFALDLGLNSSSSINASLQKPEVEKELTGSFTELRKALYQLNVKDASLLSTAQALLRWHDTHQFCSRSGQPTKKNMAGSKRVCSSNQIIYYPQMAPVVITLVSDGTRCLLARQSFFPKGMYSALAGFCDIGKEFRIRLNLRELEAAAWFRHDEVAIALRRNNPYTQQQNGAFPFCLPPKFAIAHQLIKEWVEKPIRFTLPV
ncbi:nucleoside diphosphate-linked moiety X motif 13 [Camelus ferus]|nr:nucleoside diphosphate-linked moiety X motif 13 [Camelus ferus]